MFELEELKDIDNNDQIDDAIWEFVKLVAKKKGVRNLNSDEFNSEDIFEVRNLIIDKLEMIKEYKESE